MRFLPFAMLGTALDEADTWDPIRSEYPTSQVASVDQDLVLTTTPGGNQRNVAEPSSWVDPAVPVTGIFPETVSWPSVSELTTYPAPSETSAVDSISSEASPTSIPDATVYTTPSPSPTSSATSSISNLSSLTSTQTTTISASASASASASETTAASDPTTFSGGPSKTTKIAIAVPVSVIGLALILALLFFLFRRRRREKERNALPPPYDIATAHRSGVSTQELMMSPKSPTPEPRRSLSTPAMSSTATATSMPVPMPMPRIPIISISPSTESRGRTPTPDPSPGLGSVHRMSMARGAGDSEAEIGVAVAVPMDQRRSATEQDLRGRVASATSSRGPSRLARMPFEDFSDDEVGIGIAVGGSDEDDDDDDDDDDAVSDVSDLEGRRRERDFDQVSVVLSFDEVSPIGEQERRRFQGV
ncbi:hypothetical protein N7519_001472 [Penicillium mononematosum]|uniref:uncharacterized protein n=1 Tax=Penicillium mononematosum TaxID=268346 RepID=UPI002548DA93|nr:uncharacterized protein N7519_001472 [Penicillium mononematosum]KAJ6191451.1 hypothetical protein N7519_001472 [Penicillium mononematosum]